MLGETALADPDLAACADAATAAYRIKIDSKITSGLKKLRSAADPSPQARWREDDEGIVSHGASVPRDAWLSPRRWYRPPPRYPH